MKTPWVVLLRGASQDRSSGQDYSTSPSQVVPRWAARCPTGALAGTRVPGAVQVTRGTRGTAIFDLTSSRQT
eukprot:522053-Rhodomonas_salina.3